MQHKSLRTRLAAATMSVAAVTAIAGGIAGSGTASAGAPLPPPAGHLVGPFGTPDHCRGAFGRPYLPKTDCFYSASPTGWFFIGRIGA